MSNTITAYFKGRVGVAESVYQNDYGIVMAFDSIDLPAHFDCYFSRLNQEEALPGLGADNRVTIPNSILANPGNVTIHIPLHTGEDDSEVEYVIYFKVIGRARPIDDGTPAQMTAIERALALLSQPITNIEEIVNEALSFTGDTFDEMKAELQEDFDNYTETLEGDLATWKGGVESDIDDVEHDFTVLQNQFDTAVAAVSTDTEVTDIRVGADGVTDTTAGASVRRQFNDVKSALNFRVCENTNVTAGKNLFDLKTWLTRNTITYTESGGAVIFTPKSAILSDPFILADDDIEVVVNVSMSSAGNTYLIFKDKSGTNVLTGSSLTNKTIKCSKILMNWPSGKETTATVSIVGAGKSNDTLAAEVEPLTDKVENSIDRHSFNLLEGYTPSESTLLNYSTGATSSSTGFFTYEDIDVSDYNGGMLHTYSSYMASQGQTTYSRFAFYDSSHTYISGQNPNESSGLGAPIPSNAKYLSVCFAYVNGNVLDGKPDVVWASPILQQKQTAFALDNDLSYNKKSDVFMPYKGKRKGIITITIDGDFDYNPRIVGMAEKHGMRIGIAPPYTTDFAYNGIKLYKMWENNGHEILVHGRYNIGSDSPYTDAQIAEFIEAARDTMDAYGFNVHGYVAYQGNSKASSREVIKNYFDYGYTASNHSGSQAAPNDESCCFISSNSPYFMFRYSMQTSTLAQQKAAVDRCVETGGLLTLYGHAESANNDYFTPTNFDELLTYIETKDVEVVTPYEAMQKFYTLRSADLFESISDISGQMTVNENFTVITADAFYIPTLHLCSLDLRLRCNNPSGVNTGGSFSFVSGLPFTRTRYYIDSNPSNLEAFMYEGNLRTMASVAIANNADIYLSGVFYANRY